MVTQSKPLKPDDAPEAKQKNHVTEAILKQIYFSFQNNLYQPEKGISMRSPVSNAVTEIYPQHLETHLKKD
jgi:hypothetical protein